LTGLRPEIDKKVDQYAIMADSQVAMIKAIRDQNKSGVDFIKIYATGTLRHVSREDFSSLSQLSVDEVRLMVKEAGRWGMDVASHAYGGPGAYNSVAGGVRSIEHGLFLDEKTLELMVDKGTFWSPTMSAYVPGPGDDAEMTDFLNKIVEKHQKTFVSAMDKGVKIAFGTDIGALPHGSGWQELKRMADYGMAPMEVLKSATITGAELLRKEKSLGHIAAGYLADIIAVDGNPDKDIEVLRNISFVMVDGVVIKEEK
ncbi:MAG: amidohydrolase family protein, partial [Candidatus Neomarinimicrobiota bacterium]